MELVAIGKTGFLPGFALAGVQKTVLANRENVLEKLREHSDAGIVILEEELIADLPSIQLEALEISTKPVIIFLGSMTEERRMRKAVMNTFGVDLLK